MRNIVVVLLILLFPACSYKAPTHVNPALTIASNYQERIDGKFAIFVNAEKMRETVKVSGWVCSAHSYPINAELIFKTSTIKTFENIAGSLVVVDAPLTLEKIYTENLNGFIHVEVEDLDIDLRLLSGFFSSEFEADAEITARITVNGKEGRLLGRTVEGSEDYQAEGGLACEGGSVAVGKAVEKSMEETLNRLAESFANSPRLRNR